MNHSFRRCLSALSLLGPLALSPIAAAQDVAAADALFNRGVNEMKAGKYPEACPLIAESMRLDPQPGTLFTLSQCEVKWDRVATAVARLDDYLQLYERLTPDQKAQQLHRPKLVKEQRDRLAPDVPELTLSLPAGAPAGTVVKRDDAVVSSAALGLALPVDPGEHVVSTQAPGGPLREQRITIVRADKKALVLEVTAPQAIEPTPAPPTPVVAAVPEPAKQEPLPAAGPSGRRVAVYAVGGVGLAALALGGVMGGLALGKKSVIEAHCGSAIKEPSDTSCDQTGFDAASASKPLTLVSTIGFAAGLAGIGTAVVLLLTEHRPAKAVTSARCPWISADVLSFGPTGATLGAHGTF
ncbi:MAG: hypothetical protein ABJE95_22965 [Byssovorax sp.]